MSTSSLRWRESRVRQEIYKQHLNDIETSAHQSGSLHPNGTTVAHHEQTLDSRPDNLTSGKSGRRWIRLFLDLFESIRV